MQCGIQVGGEPLQLESKHRLLDADSVIGGVILSDDPEGVRSRSLGHLVVLARDELGLREFDCARGHVLALNRYRLDSTQVAVAIGQYSIQIRCAGLPREDK